MKQTLCIILSLFALSPAWANSGSGEKFDLNATIVHHLQDAPAFYLPFNYGGTKVFEGDAGFDPTNPATFTDSETGKKFQFQGGIDFHITKRVTMMWIAALLLFAVFIPAAHLIAKDPMRVHSRFTNSVEAFVQFIRKDVVDSSMHGHGHAYEHYVLTLFFFILFSNLLGIIPPVGEILTIFSEHGDQSFLALFWNGLTVTGDVSVTMTLALLTLFLIYLTGFIFQGIKFIPHSVPNGVPLFLWPLMWPLEFIVSPGAKAFALTVRLLANMTAGHVIILALLGFIFEFQSYFIVPVSIVGAGAIYVLEIFVAFLQAYIFALLTSIFVGSAMHRH